MTPPRKAPPSYDLDLKFPCFEVPPKAPPNQNWTWKQWVLEMEPYRVYYMRHFDCPKERLANKVDKPFTL